jgi:hypothetical protein
MKCASDPPFLEPTPMLTTLHIFANGPLIARSRKLVIPYEKRVHMLVTAVGLSIIDQTETMTALK